MKDLHLITHFSVITLLLAVSVSLSAQNITVPYSMSFEESEAAELAQWQINTGSAAARCEDHWVIGTDMHSAGTQSLYISCDSLNTSRFAAHKGKSPNTIYAYRDVLVPAGTYDVTFDWYCEGASNAMLRAGYIQGTGTTFDASATSATLPAAVSGAVKNPDLWGVETWQNASMQFTSNGTRSVRIFFAWTNACVDSTKQGIGACIDNIQITDASCMRPFDVMAENLSCDSVLVRWGGTSAMYELAYRRSGSDIWRTETNLEGGVNGSFIIEGLDDGSYDFRVRGVCGDDEEVVYSAWTYLNAHMVVCTDAACVNFVAIHDPAIATCTYGETDYDYGSGGYWGGGASYDTYKNNAYDNIGVIDYGPESKQSRHTVNWDRNATDPRTGDRLKLVPNGEYASVRLGNWEYGNGAESVSYQYTVDSANAILLMKYAVVLEDPDHDAQDQPRFVLEILDPRGNLIDPTCGSCNFAADHNAAGWNTYGSGYDMVTWKDWTTIGLNLENYRGQTLTVRLTTYDCFQGGHYGYAYYTLSCAAATIETTSCASDINMNLSAPEGFYYTWYNEQTGAQVGTGRTLSLPSDNSGTYRCHLTSMENAACGFDLFAQSLPRIPVADFTYNYVPVDCKNRVEFVNKSFIRASGVDHHELGCEEYIWSFDYLGQVSNSPNPLFVYPAEGGTFHVNLQATIAEGRCTKDTTIAITIPAARDFNDTKDTLLCQGDFIEWGGEIISDKGTYPLHTKTVAGCDSDHVLHVEIVPRYELKLDTVYQCYGEQYCVDGDCYRSTTTSGMFIRKLQSSLGCDSTLLQYVEVYDAIAPEIVIDSINLLEEKYTADIHIGGTGFVRYEADFSRDGAAVHEAHQPGEDVNGLATGWCVLTFYNEHECARVDSILIGGACLKLHIEPQVVCDGPLPVAIFPLTVDSGVVTRYSVEFSDLAHEAGLQDMDMTIATADEVKIELGSMPEPGIYSAVVTFEDMVCGNFSDSIQVFVTYPASVLFYRWDDVISLKNQQAAGFRNYTFTAYQWYLNGQPVEGATRSYYHQAGGLNMDGAYVLELTREDGQVFRTCPYVPSRPTALDNALGELLVSPTMLGGGELLTVRLDADAVSDIYAATGQLVRSERLTAGNNMLTAPMAAGVYVLTVRTAYSSKAVRIVVK